jgi:flagellar biosynthesis protein FlhF
MRIKRIEAATVAEAMRQLRAELGDNALILQTKTITAPGVAGLFKRTRVELLGAIDEELPGSLTTRASVPTRAGATGEPVTVVHGRHGGFRVSDAATEARHAIAERLRSFRAAVPTAPLASYAEAEAMLSTRRGPAGERGDDGVAASAYTPFDWTPLGRRARRVAFVGPTGAGKTTTLAKVAARAQLDHGRRVRLVTIDTYRIGAVPQLASYAEILGIPLTVAHTPADVADAMAQAGDADLVFIDTTGRSPLGDGVEGLKPFVEAAGADITYLVLSAITRPRDAIRAAQGYRQLGTNALCVTRLDETDDHATLTDVASATGLPLGWLGVGQEVPDDLKEADAGTVAALVKGGHAA